MTSLTRFSKVITLPLSVICILSAVILDLLFFTLTGSIRRHRVASYIYISRLQQGSNAIGCCQAYGAVELQLAVRIVVYTRFRIDLRSQLLTNRNFRTNPSREITLLLPTSCNAFTALIL